MKRKSCLLFSAAICTAMTFGGMSPDTAQGALLYWQSFDNVPPTTTTVATPVVTPGGGNLGVATGGANGNAVFAPTGGIFGGALNSNIPNANVNGTGLAGTTSGSGTSLSNLGTMNQFTITLWVKADAFRTGALSTIDHRVLTLGDSSITDYCCGAANGVGIALRNDTTGRTNPKAIDVLVNGRSASPLDADNGNPTGIPGTTTDANEWTFIALTYDGSSTLTNNSTIQSAATGGASSYNGQLYMGTAVDAVARFALPLGGTGTTAASHGAPGVVSAGSVAFGITGARLILANRASSGRGLDGYIDDIRLYSGVLSRSQVDAVRVWGTKGVVPEPNAMILASIGVIGLAWIVRRKRS